jgi:hypothetical protein
MEQIDKTFLEKHFGEDRGYLYEYKWVDEYFFGMRGEEPASYVPVPFKPETNESHPDPETLLEMIRTINEAPDRSFLTLLARFLDIKNLVLYLAAEAYIADHDGLLGNWGMNNFYLYRTGRTDIMTFIPWDKDVTFYDIRRPLLENVAKNVLARRVLASPQWRKLFQESVTKLLPLLGPDSEMEKELNLLYDVVREAVKEDPKRPFSYDLFENDVVKIRDFVRNRNEFIREELEKLSR